MYVATSIMVLSLRELSVRFIKLENYVKRGEDFHVKKKFMFNSG